MTLKQIIQRLEKSGVEDAAFDARQIICAAEGISCAALMADRERDYVSEQLMNMIQRREEGEPLQYVLGQWEFMGVPLTVGRGCLIPRADTEVLAALALKSLPRGGAFADLCTGSGCIAVSLLVHRPDTAGVAVELYEEALAYAVKNAEDNGVRDRLEFIKGDVCIPQLRGKFDVIVSNPPYVTLEEMNDISVEVSHEPATALTDGGDGMSIIKKIIDIYPQNLKDGGILAIEHGHLQGDLVRAYAKQKGLFAETVKDTGNRDRVTVIKKPTVVSEQ